VEEGENIKRQELPEEVPGNLRNLRNLENLKVLENKLYFSIIVELNYTKHVNQVKLVIVLNI
jgi:hypothetical protein